MIFNAKDIIFILTIYSIYAYLTFPLNKDDQNLTVVDSPKQFIERKKDSKYYILVNIGSEKVIVKTYLYMYNSELVIGGDGVRHSKYNESNSKSYKCSYCVIKEYYDGLFNEGIISYEDFHIQNEKNEIIKIDNMKFILAKHSIYLDNPEGTCGLQLPTHNSDIDYNLIVSLKKANATYSYNWYLDYENFPNKEAKMVVDGFPHELNKKYNSEKLVVTEAIVLYNSYKYPVWALKFGDICYDNIKMDLTNQQQKTAVIQFDFGMIVAPNKTQTLLEKEFFNEYYKKNICFNESLTIDSFIYCKNVKDFNIKNFKSIYFKNFDLNIVFEMSYEDLFYITNDYIYFLVIFRDSHWILGEIFLKKYYLVFNQDEKTIGYYQGMEKIKSKNDQNDNKNAFGLNLTHILLILILIALIIIGAILYLKKGKRKNKANELDDDYDYDAHINDPGNDDNVNIEGK
jgi:hypothetical protein